MSAPHLTPIPGAAAGFAARPGAMLPGFVLTGIRDTDPEPAGIRRHEPSEEP